MSNDSDCICHGNWRQLVKEHQSLYGRKYTDREGIEFTFVGIVDAEDDYYYVMLRHGHARLLSCVGSIEGHEYKLVPVAELVQALL